MPELPEVETVRRGLLPHVAGKRVEKVELRRANLRFPLPLDLSDRLVGRRVADIDRRAKYLLFRFDGDPVLLCHLGMTGRFVLAHGDGLGDGAHFPAHAELANPTPVDGGRHDHVVFHLTGDDGARTTLTYNDARRFGFMLLAESADVASHPRLRDLGPEPLGNLFNGPYLESRLAGRLTPIKAALLDQRLVSGIGNIYACEALFRAGISPRRLSANVVGSRAERLALAVRQVLDEAIAAGGSTLRDFMHADGALGYFQHRFQVYDRAGKPCVRAGCGGAVQRIAQSGRSSFYCPRCQR